MQEQDRHLARFLTREYGRSRLEITCSSGADVAASLTSGAYIFRSDEDRDNVVEASSQSGGPLYVNCERHGQYLGLLEVMDTRGGNIEGLFLVLIPMNDVEYIQPELSS